MDYKKMLKAAMDKQSELLNKALAENRALTAEEQTQFDNLETEIKNLEKTIEAQEKLAARAVAAVTPATEPIHAEPKGNEPKWKNGFGEFLRAVRNAAVPDNRVVDNRLILNAASGASEGVLSDGGFLVEQDFVKELLKRAYETGILAKRCRTIPISANSNGIKMNTVDETSRANGSRWGGVQAFWEGEADLIPSSKPKFGKMELNLKKLTGLYYATDEELADAAALGAVAEQAFGEEFGFKMDDAIIAGTGAGMPLGYTKSGALIKVSKTANQTADTVTFQNVLDMWTRMWARSRPNAVWFINQEVEPQLAKMSFTIGTEGVPVYLPAGGASVEGYSTLFGRPVIPIEQASALGDEGDIQLVDLSQYLLIDKGGINAAQSIHVRFLYDESVFRFIYRVDGQPTWKKPLQPYKGANTLSPFVILEARA